MRDRMSERKGLMLPSTPFSAGKSDTMSSSTAPPYIHISRSYTAQEGSTQVAQSRKWADSFYTMPPCLHHQQVKEAERSLPRRHHSLS